MVRRAVALGFSSFAFLLLASVAAAQTPDLAVTKLGPAFARPGTNVTYLVTVRNVGATAGLVTVTDSSPSDGGSNVMTFVSASADTGFTCTTPSVGATGTITCTAPLLATNTTATFNFVFQIPAATANGVAFTNTAAASTAGDGNTGNNSSDVVTVAQTVADLTVSKTGPAQANADTDVTYNVTVTNLGPDAAGKVTLTDNASGLTFVSSNADPAFNCTTPAVGATGAITCDALSLASGASANFTFVLHIPPATPAGTTFTNVATVSEATDPNAENDQSSAFTTTPPPPSSDLVVTKVGPNGAAPDTNVVYTITFTNSGPDPEPAASLTDTLPGTMTFVSLSQSGTPLSCTTGTTVTCTGTNYPAGASTTLTLTGHIPPGTASGTTFTNTATISGTNDPNSENNVSQTQLIVSSVDVSVAKSGPSSVAAGADATYTITVANAGPDVATGIILYDDFPGGGTFVSLVQDTGPTAFCSTPPAGTNGQIQCLWDNLSPGASAQFTLVVNSGAGTSINNTATVTTQSFDTNTPNNTSNVNTTVVQNADLGIVKTGPATVTAGTAITYSITITNAGPSNAVDAEWIDMIPGQTSFVSLTQNSGPTFTCNGGLLAASCGRSSLSPGASATFTLVLFVSPNATNGSTIFNTVNTISVGIPSGTPDNNSSNNFSTQLTTINTSADLSVVKNGPATGTAGSNLTYTIFIANAGPSDAANVVLSDTLPAGTTFVSLTQTTGPTFNCTTGPTVNCSLASFPVGSGASFTLVAAVSPSTPNGTSITNTANITSSTSDSANGNNSSSTAATIAVNADLSVTKTGPSTVPAGNNITYTISVANAGPSDAANVALSDTLPAGTSFVSLNQNTGPTFNCTTGPTVNCAIASFPAGASASFTLVAFVPAATPNGTSIANTANVSSSTADSATGNNSSTTSATVGTSADLSVAKSGPSTVAPGTDITYSVTVSNAGPSDALNVQLTDALPSGTTFAAGSQTSGPTFNCTYPAPNAAGTITCTIATFAPGATASFSFTFHVLPTASGTINNTAVVSATTSDPTPGNAAAGSAAAVTPAPTDLSITKTASGSRFEPRGTVTYTIVATNNGTAVATNVVITDVLPAGASLVSATPSQGSCSGTTTVTCNAGVILGGGSATVSLVVSLPATFGTAMNTATVSSDNTDTDPSNNAAVAAVEIVPPIPSLSPLALLLLAAALALASLAILRR